MTTLTEQLKKIEDDIVTVLKENNNKPMTEEELFKYSKLKYMAAIGYQLSVKKLWIEGRLIDSKEGYTLKNHKP